MSPAAASTLRPPSHGGPGFRLGQHTQVVLTPRLSQTFSIPKLDVSPCISFGVASAVALAKSDAERAVCGGPGWDRTSDLPRVKRTLSH